MKGYLKAIFVYNLEVVIMYNSSDIASKINYLLKVQNKSQKIMLENCGLNKNAISTMTARNSIPKADNLAKIADYLGVSVDYLLGRTDTPQVLNLPKPLISTLLSEYSKNSDDFISDDFIKEPPKSLIGQKYCFNASDYDKYQHIFDVAYKYTQENNMDILEVTGVDKEKYTDMVEYHSDIIEQIFTGKYYTFRDMSAYNKFREIYKLYVKAYVQNLISDKTE
jgi:transcriptional regulator with XRE-family HTH domain